MILADFHTHTTFSDGANTPEEMVQAAVRKGMTAIGFSEHSYTSFDPAPCMLPENAEKYKACIQNLQEKYRQQIRISCGIEQDYFSDCPASGYDYIIGSVHYVNCGRTYIAVDDTPEILREGVNRYFGGDFYRLAECYWDTVAHVVEKTNAGIIGHLDLIRKFNGNGAFFDEQDPRYLRPAYAAIDELLKTGIPFEINTGGISRGYTRTPYPEIQFIEYIRSHGGRCILSSDSHRASTLCFGFDSLEKYAN